MIAVVCVAIIASLACSNTTDFDERMTDCLKTAGSTQSAENCKYDMLSELVRDLEPRIGNTTFKLNTL